RANSPSEKRRRASPRHRVFRPGRARGPTFSPPDDRLLYGGRYSDPRSPMPHVPASTALARFRVLDLSRVRAGPTCVRQLAGFGQDGPYRDRPGFDQIAQGMGGFMSITGLPGQGPVRAGTAIADLSAGLFAALGIMTALLEREKSGKGQWVQSSLLMSQIALLDFQAARYLMTGMPPGQAGNDHPTSMPTSAYKTKDGYMNIAATGEAMWRRVCEGIGRPDMLENP